MPVTMECLNRSLRERAHWGMARFANAAVRAIGARPLLNPSLAVLGKVLGDDSSATLRIANIAVDVPLSDSYWIAAGFDGVYEPELFDFLDGLDRKPTTLFIDAGANIGWWSLLADKYWGWSAVAIEASTSLILRMTDAKKSNTAAFEVVHAAVWHDKDKLAFKSSAQAHAGGHLGNVKGFVSDWRMNENELVDTVILDSIVSQQDRKFERVIIKLDVEGAECAAIRGAQQCLKDGALLLYEDHGKDEECLPTIALMNLGLDIYSLDSKVQLNLDDVRRIKTNSFVGYNFLATNSDGWRLGSRNKNPNHEILPSNNASP